MSSSLAQHKQTKTEIDNVETNMSEENVATDQVVTSNPSESPSTHRYLQYLILITYTLRNVVQSTLRRYMHVKAAPGQRYIGSTFVFICEIQKTIFSIVLIFCQERNVVIGLKKIVRAIRNEPSISMKISLVSLVYVIQNNLTVIATKKLDIATLAVTSQLKIFTTAIFARVLLNRRLNLIQYFALFLLIIGIALVEYEDMVRKKPVKDVEPVVGCVAVVISCICSGFAGVYGEKILKNTEISLWICTIQQAVFSIFLSAFVMGILDGCEVRKHGIFHGYTNMVWIATMINSLGGLMVALILKYSDNILKGFASSLSVVLSCIIAVRYFQFPLSILFSIGSSLVVCSTLIYSNSGEILSILSFKNKPVFV